jgi:hypothetical protein
MRIEAFGVAVPVKVFRAPAETAVVCTVADSIGCVPSVAGVKTMSCMTDVRPSAVVCVKVTS